MASPYLLIDGYNLMHAAGLARPNYGPGDLERCRHHLLRLLVNYLTDEERARAKVVFDAYDAPEGLPNRYKFEGLQVRFADPGHDADSLIEELIVAHSAPRQIIVVSGDRRLQKAAHRRRAKFIGSVAFLTEILERIPRPERQETAPEAHPKYDGELTSGELAQWMELFGDAEEIVEQEQQKLAQPESQEADAMEQADDREQTAEPDEWDDLYGELGLLESELAEGIASEETLNRLQQEIDRMIEEEGESRED
jgi:predicted RNA-binding protein with PIN domain